MYSVCTKDACSQWTKVGNFKILDQKTNLREKLEEALFRLRPL
jgi:hypothetical protein